MSDEWAETSVWFRGAIYRAREKGMTFDELRNEIDEAEIDEGEDE